MHIKAGLTVFVPVNMLQTLRLLDIQTSTEKRNILP